MDSCPGMTRGPAFVAAASAAAVAAKVAHTNKQNDKQQAQQQKWQYFKREGKKIKKNNT